METTTLRIAPVLQPAWGLAPHTTASAAWGARAIYTRNHGAYQANHTKRGKLKTRGLVPWYTVDTPYDRQGAVGDEAKAKALCKWLDKVALPRLRKEIDLDTVDSGLYVIEDGDFTLHASPRASYGYLYIGAWVR